LRNYILLLLIGAAHGASAQGSAANNSLKMAPDTINLSGIVLDSNGKPAKNIFVSRPFYQCKPDYKITTRTDSTGRFHLNGLRFNDTLQVQAINFSRQVINNGSRTLQIILPPGNEVFINKPVRIEAAEIVKKKPVHTVEDKEECGGDYYYYMSSIEAEFPGGYKKMNDYIKEKLVYPEHALKNNLEGEVVIQFQISPNGTPGNFLIIAGLDKDCNETALTILRKMPKWRPAILYGRAVASTQSMAIEFFIKRP
jgi:TonB family protein